MKLQNRIGLYFALYAATFGWLCVETSNLRALVPPGIAATFGWLCVETMTNGFLSSVGKCSRLRAAVC